MASHNDNATPPGSTPASEATQSELDLRLFHLKTLYDVSRELLGIVDIQVILKNFLLMTLGNFGVAEGFIFAHDSNSTNPGVMVGFGFQDDVLASLESESLQLLKINPYFSHRNVELKMDMQPAIRIHIPSEPLEKLIVGLIKNAVENTPDEGKIKVKVRNKQNSIELVIKDAGVGIVEEHRHRIFEGFFPTQEIASYSSKTPFDFNAGGRGADLLRIMIFSERFNFKLDMQSTRCQYIPLHSDVCPGRISDCSFCRSSEDCYASGGTTFRAIFPVFDM